MGLQAVYTGLADKVSGLLYPNGSGSPSILNGTAGKPLAFKVYPGEPVSSELDADLAAGIVNISIFWSKSARNLSTIQNPILSETIPSCPLAGSVTGNTKFSLSGTVEAGIIVTATVDYEPYSYVTVATDTLDSIAQALAALIPDASANGSSVTVPGAFLVGISFGMTASIVRQSMQMLRVFWIRIWANSPVVRDMVGDFLNSILGSTYRLPLANGTVANIMFADDRPDDQLQKENLFQRDLWYRVVYQAVTKQNAYQVTSSKLSSTFTAGG